ncbi:DUF1365 domain-containing protein [Maritimibacter dapengensis]|nr:DUF1365 domain-containing protein [Maritimibacter dapengensis]
MRGSTTHVRKGSVRNAFTYGVDYLLIDPNETADLPPLFSRNSWGIFALHDRDHGGPRGDGDGVAWAQTVFTNAGLELDGVEILLLAQPRFLGFWFNPVAFWLARRDGDLIAVIAEVNNTMGDRHSYLCAKPGFEPILPSDHLTSQKVFHVSPFQEISGDYRFRFAMSEDRIAITIDLIDGNKGLTATLTGPLAPLTYPRFAGAALRRPAGALRVMALILWQAAKLTAKGAVFRKRPAPPAEEIS